MDLIQVEAVAGLSILELFLLVALCRLARKGVAAPNFQMAFDEYSSLRRGGSYRGGDETAPKPSAFRAFERLLGASLVAYIDPRSLHLLPTPELFQSDGMETFWPMDPSIHFMAESLCLKLSSAVC